HKYRKHIIYQHAPYRDRRMVAQYSPRRVWSHLFALGRRQAAFSARSRDSIRRLRRLGAPTVSARVVGQTDGLLEGEARGRTFHGNAAGARAAWRRDTRIWLSSIHAGS